MYLTVLLYKVHVDTHTDCTLVLPTMRATRFFNMVPVVHHAAENQELMAEEGGIEMLVAMLGSTHPHLQRQASKALANLGVNANNKEKISRAGGVAPLVKLAGSSKPGVAVEAVAALANLAVNGESIPTTVTVYACMYACIYSYVDGRRGEGCVFGCVSRIGVIGCVLI